MIFQSPDEIYNLIKNPINTDTIARAVQIKTKHELHVSGIGIDSFLQKVDGVENEEALKNRIKLANEATVPIMSNVRKPKDKIFHATGGYEIYTIENEDVRRDFRSNILGNVTTNTSLKEWMRTEWALRVDVDPFGIAYTEITKDGRNAYLTYKSSTDFHDIEFSATNRVEYIIFNSVTTTDGEVYRVVDDKMDYHVLRKDGNYSILENESFPHPFGIVPAVFMSSRNDKKSKSKDTWISESMPSADDYLFDNTIYRIYKTKVSIPYVYELERACVVCKGDGTVGENNDPCPACDGNGIAKNRDVADKIIIKPQADDSGKWTEPNSVAGYIQADPEAQDQMTKELDRLAKITYVSVWGEKTSEGVKTAFEVSVNKEPELDKLKMISKNAELVESFITDMFGIFYLAERYGGNVINYGDKYTLKTSLELLVIYNKNKEANASISTLNDLLSDYYKSEHDENPLSLQRALMLMVIEPYIHNSLAELSGLAPDGLDYITKQKFNDYLNRYETEVSKIQFKTIKEVKDKIKEYAEVDLAAYKPFPALTTPKTF